MKNVTTIKSNDLDLVTAIASEAAQNEQIQIWFADFLSGRSIDELSTEEIKKEIDEQRVYIINNKIWGLTNNNPSVEAYIDMLIGILVSKSI